MIIYVSKSPCFHQDCDPKCEVVDECKSNKACAKLLGLLLSKVRKELSKVDVKMTVKFLYPHLNRGDLYTKQGILCMLQAGIKVRNLRNFLIAYIIQCCHRWGDSKYFYKGCYFSRYSKYFKCLYLINFKNGLQTTCYNLKIFDEFK